MSTKLIVGILAVAIIIIGGFFFFRTPANAPATPPPAAGTPPPTAGTTPPPASSSAPQTYTVSMNASGFSPVEFTIRVGDTVVFKNDDARSRWPASGVHPTHLLCPGFDALEAVAQGKTYSHTFTEAKTCPMHDHLIPELRGKITVVEEKG